MLNFWFSSNVVFCADSYIFSRLKLKDKCRSEKWEVYLFGQVVDLLLLSTTDARWFRQCRKLWRFMHSCSTSEGGRCPCCVVVQAPQLHVETAEITQLQVVVDSSLYGGGSGDVGFFARFTGLFSHSVHLDVECRVAGTPGACSQVFCHPN